MTNKPLLYRHIRFAVTNLCNQECSFCYRKHFDINREDLFMTEDTAFQMIRFIYSKLPVANDFTLFPWGGEPLLAIELLKKLVTGFPQIRFFCNTNGTLVTEELYDWFKTQGINWELSFSLGDAYEKYGGIKEKLKHLPWMAKLTKERGFGLNLTVTNVRNLYDDYKYLHDQGFIKIAVQPLLGCDFDEGELEIYMDNWLKIVLFEKKLHPSRIILEERNPLRASRLNFIEKSEVWAREFDSSSLLYKEGSCGSGVDKLFIDTEGGVWPCDGLHMTNKNKLGSIYTDIDLTKVEWLKRLYEKEVDPFTQHCKQCEIYDVCPGKKCISLNYLITGNFYTIYPGFCKFQKALVKLLKNYVNIYKETNYAIK